MLRGLSREPRGRWWSRTARSTGPPSSPPFATRQVHRPGGSAGRMSTRPETSAKGTSVNPAGVLRVFNVPCMLNPHAGYSSMRRVPAAGSLTAVSHARPPPGCRFRFGVAAARAYAFNGNHRCGTAGHCGRLRRQRRDAHLEALRRPARSECVEGSGAGAATRRPSGAIAFQSSAPAEHMIGLPRNGQSGHHESRVRARPLRGSLFPLPRQNVCGLLDFWGSVGPDASEPP